MKKKNETLRDIFTEAFTAYKNKKLTSAESLCYKILNIDPNHFDSTFLLATMSALNNNFEGAKELLIKSLDIQPKNVSALNNLGTAYKQLGKHEEATNCYKKVLEINPNHTNANYNLGIQFYNQKNLQKAKIFFEKTVEIQANYGTAYFSLGNVYTELKEFQNALSSYQKALEINPNIVGAHNNLGLVYRELNDFENAIKCYKKALELEPNRGGTHHNLALAYKESGNFKNAIESHKSAIKYEAENFSHYFYLSELQNGVLDSTLQEKINFNIKEKKMSNINSAYAFYILSKYEKEKKQYEKELFYLTEGHKKFYDSKKEKFDLIIKYCFDDLLKIENGARVETMNRKEKSKIKPIFIIGVPRCGSTLLEKIIASGEKSIPIGEETSVIEDFVNSRRLSQKSLNLGDVVDVEAEINKIYKNKGLISEKFNYTYTDKSLNNFIYLRLIKEIYPEAKIINCRRDVLSSIMSIFQNNLSELAWTHQLDNIFKYFDNYFKIIDKFEKDNPGFIYNLQFEDLTHNPEHQTKKLMEFCSLPWSKKCLEFYKRKDLILKTTSNVQVRKSIYTHTLERYLPYKKHLQKYGEKYSWFV